MSFKAGFLRTISTMLSSLMPPGEASAVGVGPPSRLSPIVLYHMHACMQAYNYYQTRTQRVFS